MLKQLSGALVKGLNNPALVIKKIAGLVSSRNYNRLQLSIFHMCNSSLGAWLITAMV